MSCIVRGSMQDYKCSGRCLDLYSSAAVYSFSCTPFTVGFTCRRRMYTWDRSSRGQALCIHFLINVFYIVCRYLFITVDFRQYKTACSLIGFTDIVFSLLSFLFGFLNGSLLVFFIPYAMMVFQWFSLLFSLVGFLVRFLSFTILTFVQYALMFLLLNWVSFLCFPCRCSSLMFIVRGSKLSFYRLSS